MAHSSIVGGSTAKRVIKCPGSVALVQKMPPKPSSSFADTGTLLHTAIAEMLQQDSEIKHVVGSRYNGIVLTADLAEEKLKPALAALDEIDPKADMRFAVEQTVDFGDILPGVFGSADLIARLGDRAIILDWKFGDGVAVAAEESEQLMFYCAAAMRTPSLAWVFDGAKEVELIIVQPPSVKRWVTSFDRIRQFERELIYAVRQSQKPHATLYAGEHCRWCAAKPTCPQITGEAQRALATQVAAIDTKVMGEWLTRADQLESWISDLRGLAMQVMESGGAVPGYKLVAKRGTRKWVNEDEALATLLPMLPSEELMEASVLSPAQVEKKLKKLKLELPQGLTTTVSSGNTMASEDDPRPAVLMIGKQLTAALGKLV